MSPGEGDAIVIDRHAADDRLREAFQSLGDTDGRDLSAAEIDRIWQAVSGELPAPERRELVDRMAGDPALAEAWRVAHELWRASRQTTAARTPGLGSWTRPWLAAAAVLLIGVAIGIVVQRSGAPPGETFRDANHYVIESLVPPDAALPRDAFRLRWTPGPPDARYHVRVTTEDLRMLATAADLAVPELVVDRSLLSSAASGSRVLWQVEAAVPGGGTVSSQTFIVRVQ